MNVLVLRARHRPEVARELVQPLWAPSFGPGTASARLDKVIALEKRHGVQVSKRSSGSALRSKRVGSPPDLQIPAPLYRGVGRAGAGEKVKRLWERDATL
jgi:hypothetical protein